MKTMQEMWPEMDIRAVELQQALIGESFSISITLGDYVYNSEYSGKEYLISGEEEDYYICRIAGDSEKQKTAKIKKEWVGTVVEKEVKEQYVERSSDYTKKYTDQMHDWMKEKNIYDDYQESMKKDKFYKKIFKDSLDVKEEYVIKNKKTIYVGENEKVFDNQNDAFEYMRKFKEIIDKK